MYFRPIKAESLGHIDGPGNDKIAIFTSTSSSTTYIDEKHELSHRSMLRSEMVVNRTGKKIWVRMMNGFVYGIRPILGEPDGTIEFHINPSWNLMESRYGDAINLGNSEGRYEFTAAYEKYEAAGGRVKDGTRSDNGELFLGFKINANDVTAAERGYCIPGTDIMLFTDHDKAFETKHYLDKDTPSNWLKSVGYEVRVFEPKGMRDVIFANLGGEAINVPITETRNGESYVQIIYRNAHGHELRYETYLIEELLEGPGVNGIRLYTNQFDATEDIRRPLTNTQKNELEKTIERLKKTVQEEEEVMKAMLKAFDESKKEMQKEQDILKKSLKKEEERRKNQLAVIKEGLQKSEHLAKTRHDLYMKELKEDEIRAKVVHDRLIKEHRLEIDKLKGEYKFLKSKEGSGVFAKVVDIVGNVVAASARLVAVFI